MNEYLKNWLKALRSGEFRQGTDFLKRAGSQGYCCLGVLCELNKESLGGQWERHKDSVAEKFVFNNTKSAELPPNEFIRQLELPEEMIRNLSEEDKVLTILVKTIDGYRRVDDLNDNGFTFAKIANLIEETYHANKSV